MRVARLWSVRRSLLGMWCVGATASPTFAQVAAGDITGVVKAQAGASVPGATVTVTNVDTNQHRIVLSSGDGVYTAPSLAPGDYRVALRGAHDRSGVRQPPAEVLRQQHLLDAQSPAVLS